MEYKNFDEIFNVARKAKKGVRVAVAAAEEEHVLEALMKAYRESIVDPYLVGDEKKIRALLDGLQEEIPSDHIIHSDDMDKTAHIAVQLVKNRKADYLMKGIVDTSSLIKAVLDKDNGLSTGRVISHINILNIPTYKKLLGLSDTAIILRPDLAQKKDIVQNSVDALCALGYEKPKVAAVTAVEKVNSKMQETVDADALKQMSLSGELKNCIVEGPISMDLAFNADSAHIKGYISEVTNNADILLVPEMTGGNILAKALSIFTKATSSAIALGAKVPIVLTSRGASVKNKYASIVVASEMVKAD